MSNSDFTKPRTNLFQYLPDVFRSETNEAWMEASVNRMFTKDQTTYTTGYVGQGNPCALVNTQIQEPTTFRQAYQLQPTAYVEQGAQKYIFSYESFLNQLEITGVERDRLPVWGNALQFNWVPPINIDAFINYRDYFWTSEAGKMTRPDYVVIESQCSKVSSRRTAYQNTVTQRGPTQDIVDVSPANNTFTVSGYQVDLYQLGFIFYTRDTDNPNYADTWWTAASSSYDQCLDRTTITVQELIAIVSETTPPVAVYPVGRWWYDPSQEKLWQWNGTTWVIGTIVPTGVISLQELLDTYILQENCICYGDFGWDIFGWDDNQFGNIVWNTDLLIEISHPTEADWVTANGTPAGYVGGNVVGVSHAPEIWTIQGNYSLSVLPVGSKIKIIDNTDTISNGTYTVFAQAPSGPNTDVTVIEVIPGTATVTGFAYTQTLWYDTTNDILFQRDPTNTTWVQVSANFSVLLTKTTGQHRWDLSLDCIEQQQVVNQWITSNQWKNRRALLSTSGTQPARAPIIEYDSKVELNKWSKVNYTWKYRADTAGTFVSTTLQPTRLELEPVKDFYEDTGTIVLLSPLFVNTFQNADIDYTSIFVPGYRFKIVDNGSLIQAYTVEYSEFREVAPNVMATIVHTVEPYTGPLAGGGATEIRIEPLKTSVNDVFRGYHLHWLLDEATTTSVSAGTQPINPIIVEAREATPTIVYVVATANQQGIYEASPYYQKVTTSGLTFNTVVLDPLLADPTSVNPFALAGQEGVRVYINGVRQYGTYEEVSTSFTTYTSFVGTNSSVLSTFDYVTQLVFDSDIEPGSVIEIVVGTEALTSMSSYALPVRTIEDDATFSASVTAGTQPQYKNMDVYKPAEQAKTTINQYPQFNIYDVVTNDFVTTSPIFGYQESSDAEIDIVTGKRAVKDPDTGVYFFDQFILEADNAELFAYRRYATIPATYWYNPKEQNVMKWNGETWISDIVVTRLSDSTIAVITPFVGETPPTYLVDIEGALWYDTTLDKLFQREWDGFNLVWVEITDVFTSESDPTLFTIWRHGKNNEEYVPQYVDAQRQPVPITDPNGTWELADQWYFNPEHANKKYLSYTQLFTHFTTIIEQQTEVPGLIGGGMFSVLQDEFNYGVGGTIKEFNDSYDTTISAMYVNNITPTGIIEFAHNQYASLTVQAREILQRQANEIFFSVDPLSSLNFTEYTTERLIGYFANNDILSVIYGDTTAFNDVTDVGVRNWIATIPIFGLGEKVVPYVIQDPTLNLTQLICHDGHRTNVTLTLPEIDQIVRSVLSANDPRVNRPIGISGTTSPPATRLTFENPSAFGTPLRTNVYWLQTQLKLPIIGVVVGPNGSWKVNGDYREVFTAGIVFSVSGSGGGNTSYRVVNSTYTAPNTLIQVEQIVGAATPVGTITVPTRWLYRFNVFAVQQFAPSFFYGGEQLPDGTLYFNTNNNTMFKKVGFVWTAISSPGAGDISSGWEFINVELLLANMLLGIEQRLYQIAPDYDQLVFDFASLTSTPEDQELYDDLDEEQFFDYVKEVGISDPFASQFVASNPLTWNYVNCIVVDYPTADTTIEPAGSYQQTYTNYYNTPYPHLEPWKMQGYADKPSWWDATYLNDGTFGIRRWNPLVWTNVLAGIVPTGELLPDGVTPSTGAPAEVTTYNYVSVNIGATNITADKIYRPDALYPPFVAGLTGTNRSIFNDFNTQIVAPNRPFVYGDGGFIEWQWTVSGKHVYDPSIIAFKMQPIRFMHYSFGEEFVEIDQLQIGERLSKVFSHEDTAFHGDLISLTETFSANGLNQWYVNYNRFYGYDTNEEFRNYWVNWDPQLTYLFGSIIDSSTLDVFNRNIPIVQQDYDVILAQEKYLDNKWFEGFLTTVVSIPPILTRYNTQSDWRISVDTLAPTPHPIEYYESIVYPVVVDPTTDIFTMFKYNNLGSVAASKTFIVGGNQTYAFVPGEQFVVSGTYSNDGTKTIVKSIYDFLTDVTNVDVVETVYNETARGHIDIDYIDLPFETGSTIIIQSSKQVPAPLDDSLIVYCIKLNNKQFQVAQSTSEANAGFPIDMLNVGSGVVTAGLVNSTFFAQGLPASPMNSWINYQVNRNVLRVTNLPIDIAGMQNYINFINGYVARQNDLGFVYVDSTGREQDPQTGRMVTWQYELERFILWAFQLRRRTLAVPNRYEFTVGATPTDTFTYSQQVPLFLNGQKVVILSSGTIPEPIIAGVPYYYVLDTTGTFKLSISPDIANPANIITVTTPGSGRLFVGEYSPTNKFPFFELNPIRNSIWVNTPQGLISNILAGNIEGTDVQQAVFDQYGRMLTPDKLKIYRQDKQSFINMKRAIPNDVVPSAIAIENPYNYIHMGSGHLFIEGYEHALIFDDYSAEGCLIYDPFLGLNTPRFDLAFFRTTDFTLRPSVGGYYLLENQFFRNFEGSIVDTQYFYDTMLLREGTPAASRSRSIVGYTGPMDFLEILNATQKSQFLFYKGMIQAKGSNASIDAYTNSKHFVGAEVDEFWAWKVAEYGDSRQKIYPELKLYALDGQVEDVRFQFMQDFEYDPNTPEIQELERNGFEIVTQTSNKRWLDRPQQMAELHNLTLFNEAEFSTRTVFYASPTPPPVGQESGIDYWYDKTLFELNVWNGTVWTTAGVNQQLVVFHSSGPLAGSLFVNVQSCDDARVVKRVPTIPTDLREYSIIVMTEGTTGANQYFRVNSEVVRFNISEFTDLISLYTINVAVSRLNPAKLIDYKAGAVISEVPIWDPARGHYYYLAEHNIEVTDTNDPALYGTSIQPNDVSEQPWNEIEVGTRWFDTSNVGYQLYYDDRVNPDVNKRLYTWGKLADWADLKVYQWMESPVPPEQWNSYVQQYVGDLSIPLNEKPTGVARSIVFRRDRTPHAATINIYLVFGSDYLLDNWQVEGDITFNLFIGQVFEVSGTNVADGNYTVTSFDFNISNPDATTIFVAEDINPGFPVIAVNTQGNVLSVLTDQTSRFGIGVQFDITGSTGNDGTYTVTGSSFDGFETTISTAEFFTDSTIDGNITKLRFNIVGADDILETIEIVGNYTGIFAPGQTLAIENSTSNDGAYTVVSSVFTLGNTVITVTPGILSDAGPLLGQATVSSIDAPLAINFLINNLTVVGNTFTVAGDQTLIFEQGDSFDVIGSTGNDNTYTVQGATLVGPNTEIAINESFFNSTADGSIYPAITGGEIIYEPSRMYLDVLSTDPQPMFIGDGVLISGTIPPQTLTIEFQPDVKYYVYNVDTDPGLGLWYLEINEGPSADDTNAVFTQSGEDLSAVNAFRATDWFKYPQVQQRFVVALYPSLFVAPIFTLDSALFYENDSVQVYINGVTALDGQQFTVDSSLQIDLTGLISLQQRDFVEIVRLAKIVTPDEQAFDPDTSDDGTINTQYTNSYQYTERTILVQNQVTQPVYYFWVNEVSNKNQYKDDQMSIVEVQRTLIDMPIPYIVFQKPIVADPLSAETYGYGQIFGLVWDSPYLIPGENTSLYYRQAILRQAATFLNDDSRYILRFTKDLTLRDDLNDFPTKVNLKDKHAEWLLIRERQEANIDRRLWDRLTEAMAGQTLADPNVVVPALDRVLYDEVFHTDTQYGLGEGQAFCNREYALATVVGYLTDPNRVFNPIDITSFFNEHNFDSPEAIKDSMETIYNNFPTLNVNEIFFQTVLDAFATKAKYKELMKTSWVSVKGIKPFDIDGMLDDE